VRHRLIRVAVAATVLLGATASSWLTPGVTRAEAAITNNPPAWPITDPIAGPPPIPSMPPAGVETPPADVIADPITTGANCDGWQLQNNYGDRWPAASTWWEYHCTYQTEEYVDYSCQATQCNAYCFIGMFSCQFWFSDDRTDYFTWDGSNAVFYGQTYTNTIDDGSSYSSNSYWWDDATAQWYSIPQLQLLTVSKVGAGTDAVTSNPAGISCGDICHAGFGTAAVTLTATPDPSFVFAGWGGGSCSGTGPCTVSMDQARSVTAAFEPDSKVLTVSRDGSGTGTVTSNPAGVNCGSVCQTSFATGTTVMLTAVADPSSTFTGWSGVCTGTGVCEVTMDQSVGRPPG
jgi:hypothetical protein